MKLNVIGSWILIVLLAVSITNCLTANNKDTKTFSPNYDGNIVVDLKKKTKLLVTMNRDIRGEEWGRCRYSGHITKKIKGHIVYFKLHDPPPDKVRSGPCRALTVLFGQASLTLGPGKWVFKSNLPKSLDRVKIVD